LTGFATAEIDLMLMGDDEAKGRHDPAAEDVLPDLPARGQAVTRPGDLWQLGSHRLVCGDALLAGTYEQLLGPAGEQVELVFTDPPYNVPIDGHVCGAGSVKHREFAMASGEMTSQAFTAFLATALGHAAAVSPAREI
jgi:hypothetical protein